MEERVRGEVEMGAEEEHGQVWVKVAPNYHRDGA